MTAVEVAATGPKFYLGIDIGGTTSAAILADGSGNLCERRGLATGLGAEGRERTIEALLDAAAEFAGVRRIRSVGISCGGPLDADRGLILCPPNLSGWEDTPIVEIFRRRLRVPVFLENDANAGALAERHFGAGRGVDNLIFLTFGTGMGAGLILGGRLCRGAGGLAGEVGHIRLAGDGPVGFHKRGSFEGFCSGPGLAQLMASKLRAQAVDGGLPDHANGSMYPEQLTGKDVVRRALDGDELALQVVTESGEYLGRGIAILIDTLNPELVVVGSMGVRLGDLLLEPARRVVREEAIKSSVDACSIVPAGLGESIGDYAALCVALEHENQGEPNGNRDGHG